MALVGGGGAGNVAGSNPAGTGTSLNYIGNHAYAYSGTFTGSSTDQTVLDFSTGSEYLVGELQVNAPVDDDATEVGSTLVARISFNNEEIALLKCESATADTPSSERMKMLIPAYTRVTVIFDNNNTQADQYQTCTFVGRIY
jgi:hypothetical protein